LAGLGVPGAQYKEVAVTLTPPLVSFRYLPPSLAPGGEKPRVVELRIYIEYDLLVYYGTGSPWKIPIDNR